jgi:membrane-associated protein
MVELIERVLMTISQGPFPFLAYLVVAGIIFAESGLFFGFFLPGDSLLITAGALAALPTSPFRIEILLPLLFVAAVLGDNVGYWFGKKTGPRIFSRDDSRIFKKHHLESARAFYDRHGGKAIVLARFVPFVRTFAPIVAGAAQMDYRRFFSFNLLGGFLWAVGITLIGYLFVDRIPFLKQNLEWFLIAVVFLSLVPVILHQMGERRRMRAAEVAK